MTQHVLSAAAADRMKGEDIIAFDVTEPLVITDILIITGDNPRQVLSIAEEVESRCICRRQAPANAGKTSEAWILQDYYDFVALGGPESREFYADLTGWKEAPAYRPAEHLGGGEGRR